MESFENLGNILHGWAIDKVQKRLANTLNRSEKKEEGRRKKKDTAVSVRKRFRKNTLAVSVSSRAGLNQEQTCCW